MSSQLAQVLAVLYQDDTVQIFRDKICILKYYFPIPTSKNIDMIDVEAIYLRDNVDGQVWGTSPGHMDTWFALDNNRHLKTQYLEIVVRGSDVKVAFSPNDPKKVMSIIENNSAMLRAQKNLKQENYQHKTDVKYTTQQIVQQKPQTKSLGQSIKQKINEKLEGLKNVKDSVIQKYEQGKQNAYVSPDNKINVAKQNANQTWQEQKAKQGQKYIEAGQVLQDNGNKMKAQAYWNS